MFYPELVTRYMQMLLNNERFYLDKFDNTDHLIWMLNELSNNQQQSLTKKHRWLGYIQHSLIAVGFTDVMTERDYTRDLFKGD
jgi:hypothetical protein